MTVRKAELNDLAHMTALARRIQPQTRYGEIEVVEEDLRGSIIAHMMDRKHSRAYVYESDGIKGFLLGTLSQYEWNRRQLWATDSLFVAEKGGAYLLRRFVRWASNKPRVREIVLGASAGFPLAEQFYEAAGFSRVGGVYSKVIA